MNRTPNTETVYSCLHSAPILLSHLLSYDIVGERQGFETLYATKMGQLSAPREIKWNARSIARFELGSYLVLRVESKV